MQYVQKITSPTKHVDGLEKKPDALPGVNSRLQGKADGTATPAPDPVQGALEGPGSPHGLYSEVRGPLLSCFCMALTSALHTLTQEEVISQMPRHTHRLPRLTFILATRVLEPALSGTHM